MSCDSAGLPSSHVAVSLCETSTQETTPSRRDLEKWAELVAACATQATQATPLLLSQAFTPEAWRTDVEALTPEIPRSEAKLTAQVALEQSMGVNSASNGENELDRIQVRLNAGDLGELSLVVERSLSGLRVQIGAENSGVLAAIAEQGAAMAQSLASAGQSVTSLTFVSMDGVGINLARAKEASGNRARGEAAMTNDENSIDERRRKNRQLDVLG